MISEGKHKGQKKSKKTSEQWVTSKDAESVEAITDPGKESQSSVRFRKYSRDCKTREEEGPNMRSATEIARENAQSAGKRKRRRRSTKKKRRKGKKKKTRKTR